MIYRSPNPYYPDPDQLITLEVNVKNNKEDGYESQVFITVPPGLDFAKHESLKRDHPVPCDPDYKTLDKKDGYGLQ